MTVILLLVSFMGLSEYSGLHVSDVHIEGLQLVDATLVESAVREGLSGRRALGILRNNHVFLLPKKNLVESLSNQFPLKDIEIRRTNLHTITITAGERLPIFRLDYPPEHFSVIDEDGVIVFSELGTTITIPTEEEATTPEDGNDALTDIETSETPVEEPPATSVVECIFCDTFSHLTLITVSSTPPNNFDTGSSTLPKSTITSLSTIINRFESLTIPVDHITITNEAPETAEIRVLEGFLVYLDLSKDLEPQIANLGALLDEQYPTAPRNVRYIDVRYGNRLYFQ